MVTPRDMPRRLTRLPQKPTAPPAPRPVGHWDRAAYVRGIRDSGLHSYARLVALTLAELAGPDGTVAEERMPDLFALARATGITIARARISLRNLQRSGWAWTSQPPHSTQFGEIRLMRPGRARAHAERAASA
ncbi:hypothetical protein ACFRNT_14325 [Streptomyces sp. NPDC056697]|uniref:hypothetical protein n=1 Tax=Streptomyces sp. NPDC056697 TaxID=3345915 RepID=UPI0036A9C75B